jgi:hypothetical protein
MLGNLNKVSEHMAKPSKPPQAPKRRLFAKPETVSFQIEEEEANIIRDIAFGRRIPHSQWLREAVVEKLKREKVA